MCSIFKLTSQVTRFFGNSYLRNPQYLNVQNLRKMDFRSISLFNGVEDRFNGVTVDSTVENCSSEEFPKKLEDSLKFWTENKKRGIWFKVGEAQSEWVPILIQQGFSFHHANPGYVMLFSWIAQESCNIPNYAHTMLAVGAIVVNDKKEILLVRDKYYLSKHWKFPGGIVDPGEDLVTAAIREVKEETNIDGTFESLICLRHAHKGMFDCSDLYIVFSLKALNTEIRKCPREIMDCKWSTIEDFLSSDEATDLNKLFVQRYLEYKEKNIKIEYKEGFHQILKKHYVTYSAIEDDANLVKANGAL